MSLNPGLKFLHFSAALLFIAGLCSTPLRAQVQVWLTTADRSSLLAQQTSLKWAAVSAAGDPATVIRVDDSQRFQTMDGFGHALTGGSAELLMKMTPAARHRLLQELFGNGPGQVHTSYLRISVGASDMNESVYTYDDLPAGDTDPRLKHFSLSHDQQDVIPVLKEILRIQPSIHIMATPWTAPAWMKDNHALKGGALDKQYYAAYARYWVMYLKTMQALGIPIATLSPQNEPENANNLPSMLMTAEQEADFIGHDLGPALAAAGLKTRIIGFDHNCDHPQYAETILSDPAAARYTDGSGFHLYLGTIDALTQVHDAFPHKNIYFTEQMVIPHRAERQGSPAPEPASLTLAQPVARLIIGAPANWSRNVLLWNLAADPENGPHTPDGGCPVCTGALTLSGDNVTRLVAYYTVAHASKFVPPGSVRIDSGNASLPHIAFITPAGKHVVIVSNDTPAAQTFQLQSQGRQAAATLATGSVASYVW